jgi:hypothetical protein
MGSGASRGGAQRHDAPQHEAHDQQIQELRHGGGDKDRPFLVLYSVTEDEAIVERIAESLRSRNVILHTITSAGALMLVWS